VIHNRCNSTASFRATAITARFLAFFPQILDIRLWKAGREAEIDVNPSHYISHQSSRSLCKSKPRNRSRGRGNSKVQEGPAEGARTIDPGQQSGEREPMSTLARGTISWNRHVRRIPQR
jgi:hypothetical protein